MARRPLEVAASAVGLLVLLVALWPPRRVYWAALAGVIGEVPTMAVAFLAAALAGVGVATATAVGLRSLAVGGLLALVAVVALVEAWLAPESPVHRYLYAALLGAILLGAAAARLDGGVDQSR